MSKLPKGESYFWKEETRKGCKRNGGRYSRYGFIEKLFNYTNRKMGSLSKFVVFIFHRKNSLECVFIHHLFVPFYCSMRHHESSVDFHLSSSQFNFDNLYCVFALNVLAYVPKLNSEVPSLRYLD